MRRAVPKKGGLIIILRDQHHPSDVETRTEESMGNPEARHRYRHHCCVIRSDRNSFYSKAEKSAQSELKAISNNLGITSN